MDELQNVAKVLGYYFKYRIAFAEFLGGQSEYDSWKESFRLWESELEKLDPQQLSRYFNFKDMMEID